MNYRKIGSKEIYNIYSRTRKNIESSKINFKGSCNFRYDEFYSYRILENLRLDSIFENDIYKSIERLVKMENLDIIDNLFTVVASGYSHTGRRRTRNSNNDDNLTELIEYRLNSFVVPIIYFIKRKLYDEDRFYQVFTKSEKYDFEELIQCMLSNTLTPEEEERLYNYFKKDQVVSSFIDEIESNVIMGNKYNYPVDQDNFLYNKTKKIVKRYDSILIYLKSILYNIQGSYINLILAEHRSNTPYKKLLRSISDFRLIIESDIGSERLQKVEFNNGVIVEPKKIVIANYEIIKEIEPTKFEKYIEKVNSTENKNKYEINDKVDEIRAVKGGN